MGWVHGVFQITPSTGAMRQVAIFQPPQLTWDAALWVDGAVDHATETMYLFFVTTADTFLVAAALAGKPNSVTSVTLPPGGQALAQPVYYNGSLYGWIGQQNSQLVQMDVASGLTKVVAGVYV